MSDYSGGAAATRVPPHNLDAEESLLGAMLLSRNAIAAAIDAGVTHGSFYKPAHGLIFDAIISLFAAGEPADPVTVIDELAAAGLVEQLGNVSLSKLMSTTPATSNADRYATIVVEAHQLRRAIATADTLATGAYTPGADATAVIDQAAQDLHDLAQHKPDSTLQATADTVWATLDAIEEGPAAGTPTGWTDLDKLITGLQPGGLYVVGARPAMGKTAFALGLASSVATDAGLPVLVFSLEMSQLELTTRLLSTLGSVDSKRIREGRMQTVDWTKLQAAAEKLNTAPIWIDDNPQTGVMGMRAAARTVQQKAGGLGLIVIDYIQLMSGRANAENRQTEVAEISRNLKILARDLDVPVVALAQLNRGLEQRADKRPMLADLRESGALEQDADAVMFLYRDEVYHSESPDAGMAEIILAKHRAGPTGTIRLAFNGRYTRFDSMAHPASHGHAGTRQVAA